MTSALNKDEIQKLYTAKARLYDWLFSHLLGWEGAMKRFFIKEKYLFPAMKILDAGCGSGAATRALYKAAVRSVISPVTFHGFDFTPAMLDRFKSWLVKNKIYNIELAVADVLDMHTLPASWSGYDLVVASGLFEYIAKDKLARAIGNLRDLLKPNGIMVVFISKHTKANRLIQRLWKQAMFAESEVKNAFTDAGFSKIALKRLPFPDKYLHDWCYIIEAIK